MLGKEAYMIYNNVIVIDIDFNLWYLSILNEKLETIAKLNFIKRI
ncbi:unnamed protein product [Arabidopsis halleri]